MKGPVTPDSRDCGKDVPTGLAVASRGEFLKRSALAGGGLAGGAALAGWIPRFATSAPSRAQDVRILNFLLLLEHLQAGFYAKAVEDGALEGELAQFARVVGEHERAHVALLTQRLGDDARGAPTFDFGDATRETGAFARTALELEEMGAAAYVGQGANLTKRSMTAALRIVAVEARHTAWIRDFIGENPAPRAADPSRSPAQVTQAIEDAGFVKES